MQTTSRLAIIIGVFAALTGCGGGGSDSVAPPSSYDLTGVTGNGVAVGGKLIYPVMSGGHTYYYWDVSGDGTGAGVDYVYHDLLDQIFNGGTSGDSAYDTTDTTGNTVTLSNGMQIHLPTATELSALYTAKGTPSGWEVASYPYYASATQSGANVHDGVNFSTGASSSGSDSVALSRAAIEVK